MIPRLFSTALKAQGLTTKFEVSRAVYASTDPPAEETPHCLASIIEMGGNPGDVDEDHGITLTSCHHKQIRNGLGR